LLLGQEKLDQLQIVEMQPPVDNIVSGLNLRNGFSLQTSPSKYFTSLLQVRRRFANIASTPGGDSNTQPQGDSSHLPLQQGGAPATPVINYSLQSDSPRATYSHLGPQTTDPKPSIPVFVGLPTCSQAQQWPHSAPAEDPFYPPQLDKQPLVEVAGHESEAQLLQSHGLQGQGRPSEAPPGLGGWAGGEQQWQGSGAPSDGMDAQLQGFVNHGPFVEWSQQPQNHLPHMEQYPETQPPLFGHSQQARTPTPYFEVQKGEPPHAHNYFHAFGQAQQNVQPAFGGHNRGSLRGQNFEGRGEGWTDAELEDLRDLLGCVLPSSEDAALMQKVSVSGFMLTHWSLSAVQLNLGQGPSLRECG
jgi:hypothetical protein